MKHRYLQPHREIADYVRSVLVMEGDGEPDPEALPIVTNGMSTFLCKTRATTDGEQHVDHLLIFARPGPPSLWTSDPQTTIIAYFFKPFALATVFNMPAKELAGEPLALALWDAHITNALRTQLRYADTIDHRLAALDHLLINLINKNRRNCQLIQSATDRMMHDTGTEILSDLLVSLQLNERTFQRLFKKYVGVTANHYRRICQFQLSFTQVRTGEFETLADVAYENGFADQSHFIRAFKEFTDTTPKDYLKSGLKEKAKG